MYLVIQEMQLYSIHFITSVVTLPSVKKGGLKACTENTIDVAGAPAASHLLRGLGGREIHTKFKKLHNNPVK